MLKMVEFIDDHPVDKGPRRKYVDRVNRMLKGEKSQIDWFAVIMTQYTTQFWLDFNRAIEKCDQTFCSQIAFEYQQDVEIATKYKQQFGEPFPGAI